MEPDVNSLHSQKQSPAHLGTLARLPHTPCSKLGAYPSASAGLPGERRAPACYAVLYPPVQGGQSRTEHAGASISDMSFLLAGPKSICSSITAFSYRDLKLT